MWYGHRPFGSHTWPTHAHFSNEKWICCCIQGNTINCASRIKEQFWTLDVRISNFEMFFFEFDNLIKMFQVDFAKWHPSKRGKFSRTINSDWTWWPRVTFWHYMFVEPTAPAGAMSYSYWNTEIIWKITLKTL